MADLGSSLIMHHILKVIVPFTLVHNILLTAYHVYKVLPRNTNRKISQMQKLSIFCLINFDIYGIWVVIANDLYDTLNLHFIPCQLITTLAAILFAWAHFALYYLFFQRLFSVFTDSNLAFKKYQMYLSSILLILFFSIYLFIVCIFAKSSGSYNNLHKSCSAYYAWFIVIIYALFDTLICTIIQILFARRLLLAHLSTFSQQRINKRSSIITSFNNDDQDSEVVVMLTKSTLLTFFAIFTNQISLILTALLSLPSLWLAMNSMVNCWCVILLFKVHSNCFHFICGTMKQYFVTVQCLYCYSCDCCCSINDTLITTNNNIKCKAGHVIQVNNTSIGRVSSSTTVTVAVTTN